MEAAYIYFGLMAVSAVLTVCVMVWIRVLQGEGFVFLDFATAIYHIGGLWFMWMILDFMVTFCATQPRDGFIAHMPWIVGAFCILGAKIGHLMRLRAQAGTHQR